MSNIFPPFLVINTGLKGSNFSFKVPLFLSTLAIFFQKRKKEKKKRKEKKRRKKKMAERRKRVSPKGCRKGAKFLCVCCRRSRTSKYHHYHSSTNTIGRIPLLLSQKQPLGSGKVCSACFFENYNFWKVDLYFRLSPSLCFLNFFSFYFSRPLPLLPLILMRTSLTSHLLTKPPSNQTIWKMSPLSPTRQH